MVWGGWEGGGEEMEGWCGGVEGRRVGGGWKSVPDIFFGSASVQYFSSEEWDAVSAKRRMTVTTIARARSTQSAFTHHGFSMHFAGLR